MIGIKKNNFLEINNIKNRNLICLDFDDCIIEWNRCQNKEIPKCKNELLTSLQRNVKIINEFCKKKKYEVFITSSWSNCFEKDLQPIKECFDNLMFEIWNVIKTLPIIGYDPFGDREITMDVLLDNGNKISHPNSSLETLTNSLYLCLNICSGCLGSENCANSCC